MNKIRKKLLLCLIAVLSLCPAAGISAEDIVHNIILETNSARLDGVSVPEYDYTWHADPSTVHDDVKNAPAEYYTGTKPSGDDAVYIAHDIFYFPEVPVEEFKMVFYDDDMEWAYYYPNEEYSGYIWALLPVQNNSIPTRMMHNEEEAYANPVLHITQPGTYQLTGSWQGQVWIDLGSQDDTFADENAKVKLILNGVDVSCTVAPALVFYSVYEADNGWEERESYGPEVDISDAGAVVVIADDTENTFSGANVSRMLKAKYKDEDSTDAVKVQKKQRKTDGAFYSYRSILIEGGEVGNGVLNIISDNEGLDSELHLTINSGKVNIQSQDDGVNVNEDGVSVLTVNGGELHIVAGLGVEGDGVDSNGYLVINGGVVISAAKPLSDSGLDSDFGSFVNGGYVVATGSAMDWAESDSKQVTMNLQFAADQASDEAIIVTDTNGTVLFAYDPDKDETTGSYNRGYRGAVISSPEFKTGETYNVYVGGDVEGTDVDGLYDIATVSTFSGAKRQVYTGTNVRGFGRGGFGGPGGRGERPEPPEGGFPGGTGMFPGGPMMWMFDGIEGLEMGEDGKVSVSDEAAEAILVKISEMGIETDETAEQIAAITTMDELFALFGGMMPGPGRMGGPGPRPDGQGGIPGGRPEPPQGGFPGGDFGGESADEPSSDFFMNDTVNAFSGVTDESAQ